MNVEGGCSLVAVWVRWDVGGVSVACLMLMRSDGSLISSHSVCVSQCVVSRCHGDVRCGWQASVVCLPSLTRLFLAGLTGIDTTRTLEEESG